MIRLVKLPAPVLSLGARIDAMSLRERAILFLMLLAGLFMVADQLLFPPVRTQQKQIEKQLGDRLTQLRTINDQIDRIVIDSTSDPDAVQRQRLDALHQQFADLEQSAASITRGLVSPRDMARLVHAMLRENRALELVKAENLAPEPMSLTTPDKPAVTETAALYRHGLRVEVKGRYVDIVRYLHALEQLSWRVTWGDIKIVAEHHPVTHAVFTLYTISLDKAWIGV